ncbi:MAG TPA: hypothetical protein VNV87_01765 [Acidimicrobiales bacterium]|nr:hypothetical protein [Acidimicrobiales bacterium]
MAGNYLDSRLIVPVVRRQHVVEHQGWNVAGIGDGTSSDPNALRLRRNAHLLIRLTDHHEDGSVPLPVLYFRELAFMLIRVADDMEGER